MAYAPTMVAKDHEAHPLVPLPRHVEWHDGICALPSDVAVVADQPDAAAVATMFVMDLATQSGIRPHLAAEPRGIDVTLQLHAHRADLGTEGYELFAAADGLGLVAATPHGLWNATRTALQLIHVDGTLPAAHILDMPRFEWRGAMLDVARHPFTAGDVCRFVDLIARHKLNRLHLHLTDDQGWRLEIPDWPALTLVGGSTATGGDAGGWFTLSDWAHIVAYASDRFVSIVPEVDMPGHTNAALASVPNLNPDGVAPPLYTGKEVGFSSLRLDLPLTRRFVSDVVATLAAVTPGEYLHIGGDEAHSTDPDAYVEFITFLQMEVERHGKSMVGWEEITAAPLNRHSLVQHWLRPETAAKAPRACRIIMSPARHTYLDMQHAEGDPIGRRWAGAIDLPTIHDWDPATQIPDVDDHRIAGVEAPLWTEKVRTFEQVQTLCFPRLLCLAEVGWTQQAQRSWPSFAPRLAAATERLAADGVPVYRSASLASDG